jgi:hypothetical protein
MTIRERVQITVETSDHGHPQPTLQVLGGQERERRSLALRLAAEVLDLMPKSAEYAVVPGYDYFHVEVGQGDERAQADEGVSLMHQAVGRLDGKMESDAGWLARVRQAAHADALLEVKAGKWPTLSLAAGVMLLDLLQECLPVVRTACYDDLALRVENVLRAAGRAA